MVHKVKIKFKCVDLLSSSVNSFFDKIISCSEIKHFNDENIKVASFSDIDFSVFLTVANPGFPTWGANGWAGGGGH